MTQPRPAVPRSRGSAAIPADSGRTRTRVDPSIRYASIRPSSPSPDRDADPARNLLERRARVALPRSRLRPPRAPDNRSLSRHPGAPGDVHRTVGVGRAGASRVREAGVPAIPRVWNPPAWLCPGRLQVLQPQPPRAVLLQGTRLLPLVLRSPDGGDFGPSRRPRLPTRPRAAVGALASLRRPRPCGLRRQAPAGGAADVHPSDLRLASSEGAAARCARPPVRVGDLRTEVRLRPTN